MILSAKVKQVTIEDSLTLYLRLSWNSLCGPAGLALFVTLSVFKHLEYFGLKDINHHSSILGLRKISIH